MHLSFPVRATESGVEALGVSYLCLFCFFKLLLKQYLKNGVKIKVCTLCMLL